MGSPGVRLCPHPGKDILSLWETNQNACVSHTIPQVLPTIFTQSGIIKIKGAVAPPT